MSLALTHHLLQQLRAALAEDVGAGDATSRALFPAGAPGRARILAKQAGVLCGLPVVEALFRLADEASLVEPLLPEGARLAPGDPVARIEGDACCLLSVERTALNFLSRLSGVATLTRRMVELCAGTRVRIRDTRKTTPLWRGLEKYAVRIGGGENHRMGLDDAVMVKDTHLDALADRGRLAAAMAEWRRAGLRVYFEARDLREVELGLALGVDTIMLDNQPPERLRACLERCRGRAEVEITGGVNPGNLRALAELGPDAISLGALTHSAPALDFSMKTQVVPPHAGEPTAEPK